MKHEIGDRDMVCQRHTEGDSAGHGVSLAGEEQYALAEPRHEEEGCAESVISGFSKMSVD